MAALKETEGRDVEGLEPAYTISELMNHYKTSKETIRRVLEGLPVRQPTLEKILQTLNQAGMRGGLPVLTIAEIPID